MHRTLINHDQRPKIVDGLLTPIFMMGQGTFLYLLSQWRRPILWLCIVRTKSLLNYLTYKTKNRWHSVDAHFQNGAGRLCLPLLPKNPANTPFMNGGNRSPLRLPMMQYQNLLTLCWRSYSGAYGSLFCVQSQPIPHGWMAVTDQRSEYTWCNTKNHWHPVDADIQNGAGSIWLSLLPRMPATTTSMNDPKRSPRRWPIMQD